ncbi:MAG: peptidoglycan-binding protein [Candidatus Acididesulfobacter guangdongensis]|uniref:Peptidoglycan-binding protein n=1 Tax=Acididesulfobacter guangdongensis TaxID=2597225 RepID=A0A519BG51_ACIG2|nr:MAG: peptidoglycan-binding protein [Candidatus Acididesulfobacter guangdongensis]
MIKSKKIILNSINKFWNLHHLYKGKVDGIIGKNTISAVKVFQKKKGLHVDGIVGPLTLKALNVK